MIVPIAVLVSSQLSTTKVKIEKVAIAPYVFTEPQVGYLSKFSWTGPIPAEPLSLDPLPEVSRSVLAAMKSNGITGAAVLVMDKNQTIYSRGFGYANLTTGELFKATTASRCGSISKTATALAILRLVNDGKLSLDDEILPTIFTAREIHSVGTYKPGWNKIRVRDLMDHASGIKNNSTYLTSHAMAASLGKTMRLSLSDLFFYDLKNQALDGVGTKFSYSNLNFELLSLIIEKKTGMPFAEALRELVIKPLGIPHDQMFLSPTRSVPPDVKTSRNDVPPKEARCYQQMTKMLESIYTKGAMVPEAYGGLDGDILAGAGHIAFSAEAIATMVKTLRTRPGAFLKTSALWNEILTPPAYVALPNNNGYNASNFYSKGTVVTKTSRTQYSFSHGAMLMHAGGNYDAYKGDYQFVVISNCNMKNSTTLVDAVLTQAVKKGLAASGK